MDLLDLTLPTPAENLALDEALLDEAEEATQTREMLRLWEPGDPMVVVGRSSKIADEVRVEVCRARGIPILRRSSGGSAIVAGPGCLMYALVLNLEERPALRAIDHAHRFVLKTLAEALQPLVPTVRCQGISDLAVGQEKFSGNSVRVKRRHLLYHGTLLYGFPLELIEECLGMPPRCPSYREDRPHRAFVANLPLSATAIRQALVAAWGARDVRLDWPKAATAGLVAERYADPDWGL
jgi:lipoate-protein ligase A